jgi:hypothetical protein
VTRECHGTAVPDFFIGVDTFRRFLISAALAGNNRQESAKEKDARFRQLSQSAVRAAALKQQLQPENDLCDHRAIPNRTSDHGIQAHQQWMCQTTVIDHDANFP